MNLPRFDHEKLNVHQASLEFISWATDLIAKVGGKAAVKDQLDRASTSIPLNIAEGNGKFAIRDRCRFLCFARGSALECAACLDVLVAKHLCDGRAITQGKGTLDQDRVDADGSYQQRQLSRWRRTRILFVLRKSKSRSKSKSVA